MGRKKLNIVRLKEEERDELKRYLRKGKSPARSLTRVREYSFWQMKVLRTIRSSKH